MISSTVIADQLTIFVFFFVIIEYKDDMMIKGSKETIILEIECSLILMVDKYQLLEIQISHQVELVLIKFTTSHYASLKVLILSIIDKSVAVSNQLKNSSYTSMKDL